jgi:hypothetical protein
MNSANSEMKNSAEKTISDQNPRLLARKFRQRRRLIGETLNLSRRGGGSVGAPRDGFGRKGRMRRHQSCRLSKSIRGSIQA